MSVFLKSNNMYYFYFLHPSNAEVKERAELYLCSPSGPSWPVLRWTLPLPLSVLQSPWNQSLLSFFGSWPSESLLTCLISGYSSKFLFVFLWKIFWVHALAQVIVALLSLWRPRFSSKPDHVGFVVVKVTLEQVYLWVLRFSPVSTIWSLLHSCPFWRENILIHTYRRTDGRTAWYHSIRREHFMADNSTTLSSCKVPDIFAHF